MADDVRAPVPADQFFQVDMRAGRVVKVEPFPDARKPAFKLWIDFGPLGTKASSAQLTALYAAEDLEGRTVVAVTNLPPRTIAGFRSEVLVLGLPGSTDDEVVLLAPDQEVEPGARVY
jgi:tRNA-binding protein